MNDCLWCGSFAHAYDYCPSRADAAERQREYADLLALLALASQADR